MAGRSLIPPLTVEVVAILIFRLVPTTALSKCRWVGRSSTYSIVSSALGSSDRFYLCIVFGRRCSACHLWPSPHCFKASTLAFGCLRLRAKQLCDRAHLRG